jgi:hypothetical protein
MSDEKMYCYIIMSEESPRWGVDKTPKLIVNNFNEFPEQSVKPTVSERLGKFRRTVLKVPNKIGNAIAKVPGKLDDLTWNLRQTTAYKNLPHIVPSMFKAGKRKTRKPKKSNRKTRKNRK